MDKKIERISSFTVDHEKLEPGIYVSRVDGDVTTYDLRMRKPNAGDYMTPIAMHSMEHMFATYVRNGNMGDRVIYFGPMGCRTGFYLLVRNADNDAVLDEVMQVLYNIIHHKGKMLGATRKECGNCRSLNLNTAKNEALRYLEVLKRDDHDFKYAE